MKKLIFSALLIILLSCLSTKKETPEVQSLEQALDIAGNSSNAKDTLLLGFNFGMDSCEVSHKIDSLINTGKLFQKEGYLRYGFNIPSFSYTPAIGFVFTNDTLSKISLAFFNEKEQSIELIKNAVTAYVFRPLSDKGYKSYQEKNLLGTDNYYFIKNNTSISLKAYEHFVIMSYSNAIIEKREKQRKDKQQLQKAQQTISDL